MNSVVFSLDAELAWGYHDLHPLSETDRRRVRAARPAWKRLVRLFDRYRIPATWAVVGHLLVEDGAELRRRHPAPREWFRTYRERRETEPDRWYGRDLVRAVLDADAPHELGSHGFSHAVFDEANREVAEAELRLSRAVAERVGASFDSFVFPRNAVRHRSALGEHGFIAYRGDRSRPWPDVTGAGFARALVRYLAGAPPPPVVEPAVDEHGLVNVPSSMFLGGFTQTPWEIASAVHGDPAVRLAKLGVDGLRETDGVFHMWLHPNDLTTSEDFDRVESILSHVANRRDRGEIAVETMGEVARRVRDDKP